VSVSDLIFDERAALPRFPYCTAEQFPNKKGKAILSLASYASKERRKLWVGWFRR